MADEIEKDFDANAIRDALYGNVFSEDTEKSGRNLLVVGTVTLVTRVFDVAVKSTPLVPLDFSNQPDSLITFLAIANIALLISYVLKVINDLLRAREDWAKARKCIAIEDLIRAGRRAKETDEAVAAAEPRPDGYDPFVDEWWEEYLDTKEEILEHIGKIDAQLTDRRLATSIRWVRLVFFGGLPLLVGSAAFAHTWENAMHFLRGVVGLQ